MRKGQDRVGDGVAREDRFEAGQRPEGIDRQLGLEHLDEFAVVRLSSERLAHPGDLYRGRPIRTLVRHLASSSMVMRHRARFPTGPTIVRLAPSNYGEQ